MILARAGAAVLVADVDEVGGVSIVGEIEKLRGRAGFVVCDVSRLEDCNKAVTEAVEDFGGLHVLVNAAGVVSRASVVEASEADWDRTIAVNLKGVYLMCKYAVPEMERAGGGSIVNIASGWGLAGGKRAAAYCASKGGVVILTKAMALDHGEQNIRVNCICPGDTDTPMLRNEAEQLGEPIDEFLSEAAQRPLPGVLNPEDIANAALYLASDASSSVTGISLIVDGGGLAGTG